MTFPCFFLFHVQSPCPRGRPGRVQNSTAVPPHFRALSFESKGSTGQKIMLYNNGMHRRQQAFSMGENAVMVLGESSGTTTACHI